MDFHFDRTINQLSKEKAIHPKNVVVAVCPPITEEKFLGDRKSNIINSLKRKKEFAKLQYYKDWPNYEQNIAIHVLKSLYNIKVEYGANVFFDVEFRQFGQLLEDPSFDLIFLIAHHIQSKNKSQVEFGDGGYEVDEITALIDNINRASLPSLIFIICQSENLGNKILKKELSKGAIGTSSWNMPFVGGSYFLEIWISLFDGKRNLSETYELAIQQYWDIIQ